MTRERISLIIPTFNGAALLPSCLEAVQTQTRAPDETIVVDDASTDGTVAMLHEKFPWVSVVIHPCNTGFVGAVTSGIGASNSPIVALLNNDTEPEPQWLERLVGPLEEDHTLGSTASKMLLFDRREYLQSAGDGYSTGGVPVNRGAWTLDDGRFDAETEVFGASGGAAAYRKETLVEVGGFDPWLISYLEDTDLSWRLQLRGFPCRFVPEARVYHRIGATAGGIRPSYFCGRNFPLVLVSDVPGALLRAHWRAILREQAAIILEALRHIREPAARARLKGYAVSVGLVAEALRRRKRVQASRIVPIEQLDRLLTRR